MTTGGAHPCRRAAATHARRASGQVAAIALMLDDERPFREVAQQIKAARGSLDSLLLRLVELELERSFAGQEDWPDIDVLLRTALGHGAPGRRDIGGLRVRAREGRRPSVVLVPGADKEAAAP